MIKVFTYGTLKRGFRNHALLAGSQFLGEATTKPEYRLYDCGPYPCLVRSEHGRAIRGEVYGISETVLQRLDHLEGVPVLYQRDKIKLDADFGEVQGYFYQDDISHFVDCGNSWPRR